MTSYSILALIISWTEEPGELQSMGLQRVRHNWMTNTLYHQGSSYIYSSRSVMSDSLWVHGLYSHGILQARILECVAFPFSRGSSQPRDQTQVSHIAGRFFTSWSSREAQAYWSGQPIPSWGDLTNPGIEPGSPALQADSLPTELPGKSKAHCGKRFFVCKTFPNSLTF